MTFEHTCDDCGTVEFLERQDLFGHGWRWLYNQYVPTPADPSFRMDVTNPYRVLCGLCSGQVVEPAVVDERGVAELARMWEA